ncbi:hypothetical protein H0W91_02500 [Patescibacteria group bacterium]|nr:hypothetical protein [Patescibacteria group bacterium]
MKNIYWGILAVVVIVLGIWWFNSRGHDADEVNNVNTVASSTTSNTTNTTSTLKPTTFKGLLSQNGNFECKYEEVDPKFRSTNVIYLSGGKMRGEFRTSTSTGTVANIALYDGRYLYVWREGASTGVRTEPKTISELPSVIPADITSAAIFGTSPKNVSWDCHPWSTDASILVKPSYVKFN